MKYVFKIKRVEYRKVELDAVDIVDAVSQLKRGINKDDVVFDVTPATAYRSAESPLDPCSCVGCECKRQGVEFV